MNTILETVAAIKARHEGRHAKLLSMFREKNRDIEPTVDSKGRLHAPVDGYMLPDGWDDANEHIYAAGQFIPNPYEPDADYFFCGKWNLGHTSKVRASLAQIEQIVKFLEDNNVPATVTHGKTWEQGGQQVAYAYIKGQWKRLVDAISKELEVIAKPVLVEVPEVYLDGKATVTGEVVKVKMQESFYGYQLKMMVVTKEGHKLYGTVPSALDQVQAGDVVSFTATFESGDKGMSWFKRPSKASFVLSAVAA